jgi:regulator of sirC expression with transglutaminase-like and TPR domain
MPADFACDCQFQKVLAGRRDVCLPALMLEFAADVYRDLDTLGCLAELDRLGARASKRIAELGGPGRDVRRSLQAISELLYVDEGFHGNRGEYYDPRNSYLNEVLARRRGIPISLGVLYMAVARRCGVPMHGVATPGHFLVACQTPTDVWYVDPFQDGDLLTRDECRQRIAQSVGHPLAVSDEQFRPATPLEIAIRLLRNLKTAYARCDRWPEMLPLQRRLALLLPGAAEEQRDLGLVYLRTGSARRALEILEPYLQGCGCDQAAELQPYVRSARRMVAELN